MSIADSFLVGDENPCLLLPSELKPCLAWTYSGCFVWCNSLWEFICGPICCFLKTLFSWSHISTPTQDLTVFLPLLPLTFLGPEGRGCMKTSHLGLSVLKSFILCPFVDLCYFPPRARGSFSDNDWVVAIHFVETESLLFLPLCLHSQSYVCLMNKMDWRQEDSWNHSIRWYQLETHTTCT